MAYRLTGCQARLSMVMCSRHLRFLGPYTAEQRSWKALIISFETWPKNAADMPAWMGFANSYVRSKETKVDELRAVQSALTIMGVMAVRWNFHVVESVLKSGVDDEA